MSQQSLEPATSAEPEPQTVVKKQRINVYTMMLVLSFISLVTACAVLHNELSRWGEGETWKTDSVAPRPRAVQAP